MVAVSAEQSVADLFPGAFGARPRAEQLYRITVRLRPSPVTLQRLVEPPTQVGHRLGLRDDLSRGARRETRRAPVCFIPAPLPLIYPDAAHGVNVGRAPELVMSEYPRPEKNTDRAPLIEARLDCEPLQRATQFIREFMRHHRIRGRRRDVVSLPRRDGDELPAKLLLSSVVVSHLRSPRCTRIGPATCRRLS